MSPERRQQQILDSAQRLVLRQGYGAATMQAIAREAGVTRPVVYEFYADREELLEDLVGRESEKALGVALGVVPALLAGEHPESLLEQSLTSFLHIVADSPDAWRLILLPPAGAPEAVRNAMELARTVVREQIRSNLSLLPPIEGGGVDLELLSAIALSASEGAARAMLTDPDEFSAERFTAVVEWLTRYIEVAWSR
ncbi:TetR/AcrR family transcriptional regulator [Nocardia bovistercoris]|uniref:TetR/AcrR family transcriptional regulator n=1 Tax=Nocardia bovistercoris TaxID=2785916 RepID=A0A931I8W2_9NOCA|nr:TetR/AcrR family transcriptional regulator [Nocardia bovistercoris]MBH0775518.1 TetR/AcrR family transcriptional regulator [Nocardia bovistercoris]